jgi:hypothetical protein
MDSQLDDTARGERSLLRHTVATLAYRAEKVLRDPPAAFAGCRAGADTRSALEIVGHLGDLLEWAEQMAQGHWTWKAASIGNWESDVERFFAALARLDARLAGEAPLGHPPGVIFQGPVADALTHVGQLALLRRLAGSPVRPESYGRAEIQPGRVGRDQSSQRREFDGDASVRR